MVIKNNNFRHEENHLYTAIGIDEQTMIQCRERIFFCHFSNALQCFDLFTERNEAPRELTTVTADLRRCLDMINDDIEYETTLFHFLNYHKLAQEAFAHWHFENDPKNSAEDKLKLQVVKMIAKLKNAASKDDKEKDHTDDDNGVNNDVEDLENIISRVDKVKASNYNFPRYMDAMGYKLKTNNEIDDMLNGLFSN